MISFPAKAWEEIRTEEDSRKVLSAFVYPMIGLCGLVVFLATLFDNGMQPQSFQIALTECCAVFVSLFGGYFLAAYIVNKLGIAMFSLEDNPALAQQLVGYSMVVTFVLEILSNILPGFLILRWIFQFYVIYVVWEGARLLVGIDEQKQMAYTIMTSLLIVICPAVLGILFNKLSYILN